MTPDAPRTATTLYAAPDTPGKALRVVVVAALQIPAWVRTLHELASGHDWIELLLVAASDAPLPTVDSIDFDVRAVVGLERAVLGNHDAVLALVDMPAGHVDASTEHEARLPARIGALQPDVVLLLGPQAWAAELAEQARWGCWHVDASLTDPRHAGLSLLAPLLRRESATRTQLTLQGPTRAPIVLSESWGSTRAGSFLLQREDALRKLPPLLLRALRRLAAGEIPASPRASATLQLQAPEPAVGAGAGVRSLLASLRAVARSQAKRFGSGGSWMLMLPRQGPMLDPEAPTVNAHGYLRPRKGYWADPCVVATDGRKLLFVEEVADLKQVKGTIACLEILEDGVRRLGVALEEPGHLSFPLPFQWDGQWYMTVESSEARRVSLYRAADFPLGWERVRDLVVGRVCVDPALHFHEGHWYLFANVAESGNSTWDELFLFVADSLEGPFTPHPANPIVSDVRRARMAGKLFQRHRRLIRPAQDCAAGYGTAIAFNEVLELSPTVYRERPLSRLASHWAESLDGCHTYSTDGHNEVLDVHGRVPPGAFQLTVLDADGGLDSAHHAQPVGPTLAASMTGPRARGSVAPR